VTTKSSLKIINANYCVPERKRAVRKIDVCNIPISAAVIQQTKLQIFGPSAVSRAPAKNTGLKKL
jgi:hypothetical protein